MPLAPANGIEIFYETIGDDDGVPLVLVSGLGSQLISWDPMFCEALAARGFRVIRFDNRDVGLSTKFEEAGHIDFSESRDAVSKGEKVDVPYLLADMANDLMGLLDHLGIDSAHIVGRSMGGMIVQAAVIEHPARVRTLTSIMSTTGDPDVGGSTPEALGVLLAKPATDRDEYIEKFLREWQVLCGPGLFDEAWYRTRGEAQYDRCYYPAGAARQILGIMASGSRTEALRNVHVPTLVVHGTADPLVDVSGGVRTAEAIEGAELLLLEGMGHDFPPKFYGQVIDAVSALAQTANAN
jgi:pimeloyl-ACP methyl ester carboxylesterase